MASKGLEGTSKLYSKGKDKISELELGEKVSALSEDAKNMISEKITQQSHGQGQKYEAPKFEKERFLPQKKSNPVEISKKSPVRVDRVPKINPIIDNNIQFNENSSSRFPCVALNLKSVKNTDGEPLLDTIITKFRARIAALTKALPPMKII